MLEAQKELVKSTLPALREHGEATARIFNRHLLAAHPEFRAMFATGDLDDGEQARRFLGAILAHVDNMDRLDRLGPTVININQRHVTMGVRPEHYPIVGIYLLLAIHEVLGKAATADVLVAWSVVYSELSEVMIASERSMYEDGSQAISA